MAFAGLFGLFREADDAGYVKLTDLPTRWVPSTAPATKVLWLNATDLRLELDNIPASLAPGIDVGAATALPANQRPKRCFQGQTPGVTKTPDGAHGFVLDADMRATLIARDASSATYIHPFLGGQELLHDLSIDRWVIDLPHRDALDAQHDAPALVEHLKKTVLPVRQAAAKREAAENADRRAASSTARQDHARTKFLETWWMHWRRRADMITAVEALPRYIATSRVASEERFTIFTFVDAAVRAGDSLVALALDDTYSLGVLHSYLHRTWFEHRSSSLESRLRYTSSTVWDSFPWPQAPSSQQVIAIEQVMEAILEVRSANLERGMSLAAQYDTLRTPGKSRLRDRPARRPRRWCTHRLRLRSL